MELTVVILVLLSMVALLFISGRAWKRGADRALCLVNIETAQKAVRSFSNLYGHAPGENVPGLEDRLFGPGRFIEMRPECPGAGTYTTLEDQVPEIGVPYMSCSLASNGLSHKPDNTDDW